MSFLVLIKCLFGAAYSFYKSAAYRTRDLDFCFVVGTVLVIFGLIFVAI
jgi:hypothetical protein